MRAPRNAFPMPLARVAPILLLAFAPPARANPANGTAHSSATAPNPSDTDRAAPDEGRLTASAHPAAPDANRNSLDAATATLEVFPYASRGRALRCTAFHVGGGLMATAGHCFLGARDCNGAHVVFNSKARRPFPRKHACLRVESVSADVSRDASIGTDIALFRIAEPPSDRLSPADGSGLPADARLVSVEGLLGHRTAKRTGVATCSGAAPWPTDFFGRPRPRPVLRSSCTHGGFAHGAPVLLPGTSGVIGMVTGAFRLPTSRSSFATAIAAFGRRGLESSGSGEVRPGDVVHVGSFSTEAFPNGLEDGVDAVVARFEGMGEVDLSVSAGIASEILVTERDGGTSAFLGAPSLAEASPRKYRAPVLVRVRTAKGATGVSATLRRH